MLSSFSDFRTRLKSRLHARARAKHVYMYVHTYTYVTWPRRYLQHRCSSSSLQGARSTARSSRRSNNPPPWRRCRNVPPNARLDGRLALSQKLQDSKHRRVRLLPLLQLCLSFSLYFSIFLSHLFCDSLFPSISAIPGFFLVVLFDIRRVLLCVFFCLRLEWPRPCPLFKDSSACSIQATKDMARWRPVIRPWNTVFSCLTRVFTSAHCFREEMGSFSMRERENNRIARNKMQFTIFKLYNTRSKRTKS